MAKATERILAAIDTEAEGRAIYRHVRETFKLKKNGCAATCSLVLERAGLLSNNYWLCSRLSAALEGKGWIFVRRASELIPGAVCFTVDQNAIKGPDHVYTFIKWLDRAKGVALVYDNYSPTPQPRNVGGPVWYKGKRLAKGRFQYALLPPG